MSLRSAVFVNDLGQPGGRQIALLLGFLAEIDLARLELKIELDRLLLELTDLEFHDFSLRRGRAASM